MSLFPIRVIEINRSRRPVNSADGAFYVLGDDMLDYVAKASLPDNPHLPAAEFLSYRIAQACNLPVPHCVWLEMPDGSFVFGSRIESAAAALSELKDRVDAVQKIILSLRDVLERLLMLDLWLCNPDRHIGNLLIRTSQVTHRMQAIAIDYSRAMWRSGFPSAPCSDFMTDAHNTGLLMKAFKQLGLFTDNTQTAILSTALAAITDADMAEWVRDIPESLRTAEVQALPQWWNTEARQQRIGELLRIRP